MQWLNEKAIHNQLTICACMHASRAATMHSCETLVVSKLYTKSPIFCIVTAIDQFVCSYGAYI